MSDIPHEPDTRPGRYYVSVRSGVRWSLLYGPFDRHADALAAVAARLADDNLPVIIGRLNHLLPPITADTPMEETHEPTTD